MKKIRDKITISITLLVVILITALVVFFNNLIRDTHLNIIKKEMNEKTDFIEPLIKQIAEFQSIKGKNGIADIAQEISEIINLRITLIDYKGQVLADSDVKDVSTMDNHRFRIEIKDAIAHKKGESIRYSNTLKIDMLYYAKSSDLFIIRLAKPLNEIDESLAKLRKVIFLIGLIIIIVAIMVTVYISRRITNPISETLAFAKDFSNGDYSRRILNYSDDEIGMLQKALNRMSDLIVEKMNILILEQNKLKVTIESISDGIAVIRKNKKIIIANKAFTSILNINEQPLDRIYYEVIRGSSFNSKIENSLTSGKREYFREKFVNGIFCDVFIIPIKEEETIQGILIVLHDITEQKRMDQLKTELVENLSHELKTPIAILKGYLETINEYINDPLLCKDFIAKALSNIDRQNSIINDMLKLNMLETLDDFPVETQKLKEIILNCIEILNAKSNVKNIAINVNIDLLNTEIMCNKFLAEEIFFNIIDNAINYTNHNGNIDITAKNKDSKIIVTISDTGIGIPQEALGRIFERFYRVSKSRSRATGGTGLGLSIVKHAIELLKWEIDVSSSNAGTTFVIEI